MRIILSFLLLISGIFVQAQNSKSLLFLSKPLSAESIKEVEAKTSGGGIEVTGVNPSEARIEVYINGNDRHDSYTKEEAQKILDKDYDFSVTVSANKLSAIAKQKRNFNNDWRNSISISYKIYVPTACGTNLNTSGGGISISNLTGVQHFNTSGGGLDVSKLSGKISGHTSGGGITVSDSKDDIDLETSGGGIQAKRCSGEIRLNTSGGSIELNDLSGNIHASTSGGNVDAEKVTGELITHTSGGNMSVTGMSGSLEASTSGGNIDVEITETGKFVKLSNSGGSVHLEVPKGKGLDLDIHGDRIKTEGLNNFSGSLEKESITGTVNGGGIPVDVHAGSGGVTLAIK